MIYITGDTHGEFNKLSKKNFKLPNDNDFVIICGDFGGIWDNSPNDKYWLKWLSERNFTTLFVDGNHENYDLLSAYPITEWNGGKVQFINDKVIHLMRGQVFSIENKTFFTMGGAASHDANARILEKNDPYFELKRKKFNSTHQSYRINHVSWWEDEMPTSKEFDEATQNLEKNNNTVDFIITHCAPTSIQTSICDISDYSINELTDYFETIKNTVNFKHWFFGHYHNDMNIDDKYTLVYNRIKKLKM